MRVFNDFWGAGQTSTSDVGNTPALKAQLRTSLLPERHILKQTIPSASWGPLQQSLVFNLLGLSTPGKKSPRIASFFPLPDELTLTSEADPNWIFPFTAPNRQLHWFFWRPNQERLQENKWGLLEPAARETFEYDVNVHGPLLMFVPCLAVDSHGVRLGYGGGYYDRFLEKFRASIVTAACVPQNFYFDTLPTDPHDIPVDIVATEDGIVMHHPADQLLCKLRT